jgi:RNA polymerase sigma factor (sigma-70 family)
MATIALAAPGMIAEHFRAGLRSNRRKSSRILIVDTRVSPQCSMEIRCFEERVMIRAPMNAAAVRQINRLFVEGTISGLTDGQLLERFLDGRDEAAFTALVERHGSMVQATCRAVVRDHGATEDAFQATFLVLVCKARTIRGREALGGWLHRVAYRIALEASADATRLRHRERLVGDVIVQDRARDDGSDDWWQILHEEVARLSEKYRLPVLLCDLEGKTHAQAASELKWGEATVRRRRARAHDLLRSRLARRGIGLTVAGVAATLGRSASAGVSNTCIRATVKAAAQMSTTAMSIAIGEVVSTMATTLLRKSLRGMLLDELKTLVGVAIAVGALGCLAWGVSMPAPDKAGAGGPHEKAHRLPTAPQAQRKAVKPNDDSNQLVTYGGRVFEASGRPVPGARVYLYHPSLKPSKDLPVRATSDAHGRFDFELPRSEFDTTYNDTPWSFGTIVARAPGYAFGLASTHGDGKDSNPQLVRDLPIEGRIIDLEGRPIVGATVKVLEVRASADGALDAWLAAIEKRPDRGNLDRELLPVGINDLTEQWFAPPVMTDADGKFRIEGIGRERVARLRFEGPTIETTHAEVRTRAGATIRVPVSTGSRANPAIIYAASFEHVVGPTRPIEGFVTDRDSGKPLAGVMVCGEWTAANPIAGSIQVITDAQGHYRLVGLPRGREGHVVAVPPCDFPVSSRPKAVPDEDLPYLRAQIAVEASNAGPLHLEITLKRGVWLKGHVVDQATGKPVDARLEYLVYNDNPHWKAFQTPQVSYARMSPRFVGKDGSFRFVAFPGPGLLAANTAGNRYALGAGVAALKHKRDGRLLATEPYLVAPDSYHVLAEIDPAPNTVSLTQDLVLEAGGSLGVTVVGPDGKALADTRVHGLNEQLRYFATPGTSTFTVNGLKPGKGRTLTFINEMKRLSGELVIRGDETLPVTVTLLPWATLTGRVVDTDGEPITAGDFYSVHLLWGYPKPDKEGRFRIEGLIPDKAYTIFLHSQGRIQGLVAKDLKLGPGEVKDLGDVVPGNPKNP